MIVFNDNLTAYFDTDETLVTLTYYAGEEVPQEDDVVIEWYGSPVKISPRQEYIDALKAHYNEGHTVIVWSGEGTKHAELVIKKLGLESYVTLIAKKPSVIYDDESPESFMSNRIYVDSVNFANPIEYTQVRLDDEDE